MPKAKSSKKKATDPARQLVDMIWKDLSKLPKAEQKKRIEVMSQVLSTYLSSEAGAGSKPLVYSFEWTPEDGAKWKPTKPGDPAGQATIQVTNVKNDVVDQIREQFPTGAVRGPDAKNEAWELVSPIGLRRLSETYEEGKRKYTRYNMEKGIPVLNLLRHTLRHIYFYLGGDRSEDHLSHAAWGLFTAMHMEETLPEMLEGLRPVKPVHPRAPEPT